MCTRPDSHTCLFLYFYFFGDGVAFSEYFCTITVLSLYGEYYAVRSFLQGDVFSTL